MFIKIAIVLLIINNYVFCLAGDDTCCNSINCIKLSGEQAINDLAKNLNTAEVPFLMKKDALFTQFIWLKEYDPIVNILSIKSYGEDVLGIANLLLDIGRFQEGIKLVEQEAKKGNSNAYVILGMEYRRGRSLPVNRKKAFSFFKKAKEKGNLDGIFYLGRCYEMGIGVNKDCKKAILLFEKGAERGHILAIFRLSEYYKKGGCGIPKDAKKAAALVEMIKQKE